MANKKDRKIRKNDLDVASETGERKMNEYLARHPKRSRVIEREEKEYLNYESQNN